MTPSDELGLPPVNDGSRPSRLALARYETGELSGAEAASVRTWLSETAEGQAWSADLEAARDRVAPFDPTALRRRAAPASAPQPANNTRYFALLAVLVAAALIAVVGIGLPDAGPTRPSESPDILIRGNAAMTVYQELDGDWTPYSGQALGEGDELGMKVDGADHDGVVVLSIDGTDALSVFYPVSGARPHPIGGTDGRLPETIVLDGAPGPEIFVAVFDHSVTDARALVEEAYAAGGVAAVQELATSRGDVDATVVRRR